MSARRRFTAGLGLLAVLFQAILFGWHHHRRGLRALAREYRRSSRGCAYFIRAHRDCPLAKRRLRQVVILPLAAFAATAVAAAAAVSGHGTALAAAVLGCAAVFAVHQVARSRSLESLAYPVAGLALGVVFTTSLAMNLIQPSPAADASPVTPSPASGPQARQPGGHPWRRLLHPLTAICAAQAALSLTLVWSNTAFADGLTPRMLVAELPENVRSALKELDIQAARAGGVFAAAGPMPSGQLERPRHSVLAIILRAAGCDRMQGFWFARPMDAEALEARLHQERRSPQTPLPVPAPRVAAVH